MVAITLNPNSSTSSVAPRPVPRLESYEIRLNPVLMMENQQAFIDEVVPHELAHLLVWKHFGRVAPTARSGSG